MKRVDNSAGAHLAHLNESVCGGYVTSRASTEPFTRSEYFMIIEYFQQHRGIKIVSTDKNPEQCNEAYSPRSQLVSYGAQVGTCFSSVIK